MPDNFNLNLHFLHFKLHVVISFEWPLTTTDKRMQADGRADGLAERGASSDEPLKNHGGTQSSLQSVQESFERTTRRTRSFSKYLELNTIDHGSVLKWHALSVIYNAHKLTKEES